MWEYREESVRHCEREPMSLKIICGGHLLSSYVTWTPFIATEPFESMKLTRVSLAGEGALFILRRGL